MKSITEQLMEASENADILRLDLKAAESALADAQAIIDAAHDRLTPASGLEHAEQLAPKIERVVSALASVRELMAEYPEHWWVARLERAIGERR